MLINIFSIAGSKSQAVAEVLKATIIENRAANNILLILKDIECIFGRKKNTINNSPRILDLDLIDCRGEIINNDELIIPHPKLCVRDFVLRPLYELDSNWIHPVYYKKIKSLLVKNNRYSINSAIKV